MNTEHKAREQIPFIRELCKDKTEAEISEAEDNFREFLSVIKDICDRLEREEVEARGGIDGTNAREIMRESRLSGT